MVFFSNWLCRFGVVILTVELLLGCAVPIPKDYTIEILSPDHRFGVTIPSGYNSSAGNTLVEVKTGRAVVDLEHTYGEVISHQMNHGGFEGKWSADGSLLYWGAFGKWTSDSIDILKLKDGKVLWQKNLNPDCLRTILERTKAADPEGYAKEKEWNKGNGAAYPEGFAIDVRLVPGQSLALPLKVHVDLTSNVKGVERDDPRLPFGIDSWLDAVLDQDGKLTFGEFHMGSRPGPPKAFGR